jgi:hypothetical protein
MKIEEFHESRAATTLQRIANGEVPSEFCSEYDPSVPSHAASIELWAKVNDAFAERLTEAKKIGAHVMLTDIIKIADCTATRPEHKKPKIDARKYLSSIWASELNPKTVIEQTTTVKNLTPRDEYISQLVDLMGVTPQEAAARYQLETGATVQ